MGHGPRQEVGRDPPDPPQQPRRRARGVEPREVDDVTVLRRHLGVAVEQPAPDRDGTAQDDAGSGLAFGFAHGWS